MALNAAVVWEIRTSGSDNNGGGYTTGATGTDFSQQTAAQYALTGIATAGAGAVFLSASAAADMVGNVCQVISGTNFTAGFYEITSVSVGVSVTVDRSLTTGVGAAGVINIGGAMASVGKIGGVIVTGNVVYIKAGTYSISSSSNNVSNGTVNNSSNYAGVGYTSTRTLTNTDTPPVLQYTTSGVTMFQDRALHVNLTIDGNSQTTSAVGISAGAFERCTYKNLTASGSASQHIHCLATGCSASVFNAYAFGCEAYSNTATPFSGGVFINCLSYGNTGASTDGFAATNSGQGMANCVAYGNGRDGFRLSGARGIAVSSSIAEANTGAGFAMTSSVALINCGSYNNTGGRRSGSNASCFDIAGVSASESFFTNAASNDFSLNNTVGAGAAARAAGFPGTFLSGLTTGYLDIGAAQHANPTGGGGESVAIFGG